MFESDYTRLRFLKAAGGQLVRHSAGQFWGVLRKPTQDADFGEQSVEAAAPSLTARTSDVDAVRKGAPLALRDFAGRDVTYYIDKHEPDGTGMTRVLLRV